MFSGVSLYWMAHIVRLTWFRGRSPQNQSDEQKTESARGDISQYTDESAPLCAQKIRFSYCQTCLLTLQDLCIHGQPSHLPAEQQKSPQTFYSWNLLPPESKWCNIILSMPQRRRMNSSCTAKMEDRAWIVCGNTPAAQLWSTDERMANNHSTEQSKRQGFTQDCAECPPPTFYLSLLTFLPPLWKAILLSVQTKNKSARRHNVESLSSDWWASEEFLKKKKKDFSS